MSKNLISILIKDVDVSLIIQTIVEEFDVKNHSETEFIYKDVLINVSDETANQKFTYDYFLKSGETSTDQFYKELYSVNSIFTGISFRAYKNSMNDFSLELAIIFFIKIISRHNADGCLDHPSFSQNGSFLKCINGIISDW